MAGVDVHVDAGARNTDRATAHTGFVARADLRGLHLVVAAEDRLGYLTELKA
jgi:hypothetical protein